MTERDYNIIIIFSFVYVVIIHQTKTVKIKMKKKFILLDVSDSMIDKNERSMEQIEMKKGEQIIIQRLFCLLLLL